MSEKDDLKRMEMLDATEAALGRFPEDGDWYRVEDGLLVKRMPFNVGDVLLSWKGLVVSVCRTEGMLSHSVERDGRHLERMEIGESSHVLNSIVYNILNGECPCWQKERE